MDHLLVCHQSLVKRAILSLQTPPSAQKWSETGKKSLKKSGIWKKTQWLYAVHNHPGFYYLQYLLREPSINLVLLYSKIVDILSKTKHNIFCYQAKLFDKSECLTLNKLTTRPRTIHCMNLKPYGRPQAKREHKSSHFKENLQVTLLK